MARLPIVGSDDGTWGDLLNEYLSVQHASGGEHKAITVPALSATTDDAFKAKLTADTQYQFIINADGKQEWGPGGTTAPDTNLFRSAADTLKTDDSLIVGGSMLSVPAGIASISGVLTASNLKRGSGSPEGSVIGSVGDLYLRTDGASGTTLYIKESGTSITGWVAAAASVTDHGALTGLGDDDHPQYHNDARGDARYQALSAYTAAGTILVGTGAGTSAERVISQASVATFETTTSTSYTDLATAGPAVTVTTGTSAIVIIGASLDPAAANATIYMAVAVSGATTVAAPAGGSPTGILGHLDINSVARMRMFGSKTFLVTGLTAGSNVFACKYKTDSGTATFGGRSIIVIPL